MGRLPYGVIFLFVMWVDMSGLFNVPGCARHGVCGLQFISQAGAMWKEKLGCGGLAVLRNIGLVCGLSA